MEQDGRCTCNVTSCHAWKSLCLNKLAAIRETNVIGLPWYRNSDFAFCSVFELHISLSVT